MYSTPLLAVLLGFLLSSCGESRAPATHQGEAWTKHVIVDALKDNETGPTHAFAAAAADYTDNGRADLIALGRERAWLYASPDYQRHDLGPVSRKGAIASYLLDVDDDGDLDYISTPYGGYITWLECPERPLEQTWSEHLIGDQTNGAHGLVLGDVDQDGRVDVIAPSAKAEGLHPSSIVWYRQPADPHAVDGWEYFVLADGNATGPTHYLGFGDINGDGRPDVSCASKGTEELVETGAWFAWWEAPEDPRQPWTKHLVEDRQWGATNCMPADINGDGITDLLATRGHDYGVQWYQGPDWQKQVIDTQIHSPHCLDLGDLDGDGDIDAATCAFGSMHAAWFENDGKGQFTTHIIDDEQAAYDIKIVDMDGDKDLDLLVAGHRSRNFVWYENPQR